MVEPLEEGGLKDLPRAVEGVAGKPDQLGTKEAQFAHMVELFAEHAGGNAVGETDVDGAVVDLAGDVGARKVLPDELEHKQLVEVGVQQRANDRIELPVVVVRALGEVDVHGLDLRLG